MVLLVALGACSKGDHASTTTSNGGSMTTAVATATAGSSNGAAASDGAKVFQTNCSSCHQASGQGMSGTFPPLAGNPVVIGNPTTVIHIIKDGLTGQISVKGATYNGQMPAWGQTLSSNDIAAVITYIRSSWGNSASAITPAQVSAAK